MYFDLLVSFGESQNLHAVAGVGTPFAPEWLRMQPCREGVEQFSAE